MSGLEAQAEALVPKVTHPLLRHLEIAGEPQTPDYIVPGVIGIGIAILAAPHGSGKTTVLLTTAMGVAGIHAPGYVLAPHHRRHVIYVAEDVHQAHRIMTSYTRSLGVDLSAVSEWFHLVSAERMSVDHLVTAGPEIARRFTTRVQLPNGATVELPPLVVLDTLPASIHMDQENDNAEASAAIAALKQQFAGLPVWLIGHVSKATMTKKDLPSLRGASAWEADANQVCYLTVEPDGSRWLVLGKRRFEAETTEFLIESFCETMTATNQFGEPEKLTLRHGVLTIPDVSRAERAQEAKQSQAQQAATKLRAGILDAVGVAHGAGVPLSRNNAAQKVGGSKQKALATIADLLDDSWLIEIDVPADMRGNPARSKFLARLTAAERDAYLAAGVLPDAKRDIPASWKKHDAGGSQKKPIPGTSEAEKAENANDSLEYSGGSRFGGSPKRNDVGTSGNRATDPNSPGLSSVVLEPTGTSGNQREPADLKERLMAQLSEVSP